VAGAAVGRNGLADRLGDADRCRVADGDADRCRVADGDADRCRVADALTFALGVAARAVRLGRTVGVAEPVPPGENGVGVAEGEDPVQAETDAEASMAKVAQPAAANLAPSAVPMMVMRIFTGPPHASGGWRTRFQVPASEKESRASPVAARAGRRQAHGSADGHKGKPIAGTDMKWPVHHWNIRLRD
jgi:hypothetical protein